MGRVITTEGKRPADATREAGLKLRADGYTYEQIGRLWGVTKQRVWEILNPKNGQPKAG